MFYSNPARNGVSASAVSRCLGGRATRDGKRFLMIQSEAEPAYTKVKIVLNWFEELKRLVPTEN